MSNRQSPEDRWSTIDFTRHSKSRMRETGFTQEQTIKALQCSEQVTLSPFMLDYKNQKYTPECQDKVTYWRFGSILFTIYEEPDGRMVLLTLTNQQAEKPKAHSPRRNPKVRPHPPDENFRAYPYRQEKKWR